MLAIFGYRAISGTLEGGTAARVAASVAPIVVVSHAPTSVPCACGPTGAEATPSPTRPSQPAPTPAGDWFWATEVTVAEEGASSDAQPISVSVTSARFGALTANTDRGASCIATGTYPSGAPIVTSGLGEAGADSSGIVRWRFFDRPAESGRASYLFTCFNESSRRTVQVLFDIP